ncbi:hypothetical protein GCM10007939_10860 [Amylibacter marinus]|uniref:HTH merR-type domain-containing protein n=1 Tax=Amylibacter marinus TaxID=1475483 RepID=A0ABQ5VUA5_9RHOB|nr:MerR family transcriptional regulator [Amylibacter marinus]GLQ34803.1 hypothetical protein GCM10007939_10860 [Amylibacter marinus]
MARKTAQAFRTITEVSDWLDTPSHVLRFWESKFSQIKPVKRAGGRRYYRPEDLRLIGGIKALLHDQGKTIASVQDLIKTEGIPEIETHSPEPLFPEKGRRAKKRAAAKTHDTPNTDTSNTLNTELKSETNTVTPPEMPPETPPSEIHGSAMGFSTPNPAPVADQDPAQENDAETQQSADIPNAIPFKLSGEDSARELITSHVSKSKSPPEDMPSTESEGASALTALNIHGATLGENIDEVEELYFQLQRLKNRMKRRLDQV